MANLLALKKFLICNIKIVSLVKLFIFSSIWIVSILYMRKRNKFDTKTLLMGMSILFFQYSSERHENLQFFMHIYLTIPSVYIYWCLVHKRLIGFELSCECCILKMISQNLTKYKVLCWILCKTVISHAPSEI